MANYPVLARLRFFDTDVCAGLLTSLAGLWITLRSFSLGLTPYLVYESRLHPTSLANLAPASAYWRVMLRNVSAGVAIFQDVGDADWPHRLRDAEGKALVYGVEYSAMKLSPGHALQPGAELLLFEVRMPQARRLADLRLPLTYCNALGERYHKEIDCLPPEGLKTRVSGVRHD